MTEQAKFTEIELKAWRAEYAAGATEEQFDLWIANCERRNLIPVQDVVLQIRSSREWDPQTKAKVFVKKAIYITTIAALRKIALRTSKYGGPLPTEWIYIDDDGNPSLVSEVMLPDPADKSRPRTPWAVRSQIVHTDYKQPVTAIARFGAYAQTYKNDEGVFLNQ